MPLVTGEDELQTGRAEAQTEARMKVSWAGMAQQRWAEGETFSLHFEVRANRILDHLNLV